MTYDEAVRYLLTLGRELASRLRALGMTTKPLITPARGQMPRQ